MSAYLAKAASKLVHVVCQVVELDEPVQRAPAVLEAFESPSDLAKLVERPGDPCDAVELCEQVSGVLGEAAQLGDAPDGAEPVEHAGQLPQGFQALAPATSGR